MNACQQDLNFPQYARFLTHHIGARHLTSSPRSPTFNAYYSDTYTLCEGKKAYQNGLTKAPKSMDIVIGSVGSHPKASLKSTSHSRSNGTRISTPKGALGAGSILRNQVQTSGIGLLNEKPLHASLKQWYAQPGDRLEVPVDGFVIDIVRDDLLIEIQTRNFASLKSKLTKLARSHPVRLVYPIVQEKWIVRLATDNGGRTIRHKSPKRGRLEDLFWELVSIPQLLSNPNFSLEVLMIRGEEVRRYKGRRAWRTRGWVSEGRRLLEVLDQHLFWESADWLKFLPDGLESFTTRDLASGIDTGTELAQKMAYCLREGKMIELIGRRGRANLYRVQPSNRLCRAPQSSIQAVPIPNGV